MKIWTLDCIRDNFHDKLHEVCILGHLHADLRSILGYVPSCASFEVLLEVHGLFLVPACFFTFL